MAEDHWHPARLIPTSGINGQEEAEKRATSALLAVMQAVREFGVGVIKPLGAPAGPVSTFIEVPFQLEDRTVYPDGLVETTRAGRTWTALVEVKTGSATLERPQIETYLDIARDNAFEVVLTISNQMAPAPGVHPVDVDKRRLRKVALHHLSWAEVLTLAVQQRVHRGVDDPDQAWILGELIRYLEHPRSGALDFSDMGSAWVPVREAVAASTLRAHDKGLPDVVSRWEQLLRFASLRLGRELGADVQVVLSRKELAEPSLRLADQAARLVESGRLTGTLRIPGAIGPLEVVADLRSGRVTVSVDVEAPREGRSTTRVNWLIRQLKDAPDGLRVDAFALGSRSSTSALLRDVRENPSALINDPKRDVRMLRLAATSPLGSKRGTGRGGFIDSVLSAVDGFYGTVVQGLRPWTVKAPQFPKGGRSAAEEAGLDVAVPPLELAEEGPADEVAPPDAAVPTDVRTAVESADDAMTDSAPDHEFSAESPSSAWPADALTIATGEMDRDQIAAHVEAIVSWDEAQQRLDNERSSDAHIDLPQESAQTAESSD